MKISDVSVQKLSEFITGDAHGWPRRSGPQLVDFFNKLGFTEEYGHGFPSRAEYTNQKVTMLNGTPELKVGINSLIDPRLWIGTNNSYFHTCAEQVVELLKYDGYEVVYDGTFYRIRETSGAIIEVRLRFTESDEIREAHIDKYVQKCRERFDSGDYAGAITIARSLVESVCTKIENELDPNVITCDGDLINQFKRIKKLLTLDPSSQDVSHSLKQVSTGLSSIVNGLASMRNKMSDAHGVAFQPSKHHAKLAVNSAKTLAEFLCDSLCHTERNHP